MRLSRLERSFIAAFHIAAVHSNWRMISTPVPQTLAAQFASRCLVQTFGCLPAPHESRPFKELILAQEQGPEVRPTRLPVAVMRLAEGSEL
jgi:hypothetical protein